MAGIKTTRFFCHTSSQRARSPNLAKRLKCWIAPIIALACLTGFGNAGTVGGVVTTDAKAPMFKMPQRAHGLLQFERNVGQAPDAVRFITHANGLTAAVYDNGMALTRNDRGRKNNSIVQLSFVGARRDAAIETREPSTARTHYLQGSDPGRWLRDVPSFAQLRQNTLYPGVDLVYYSRAGELEYDLVVNPGADPSRIRMRVKGEHKPQLSVTGDLLLDGTNGALSLHRPIAYQNIDGVRKTIDGRYVMLASSEVGFKMEAYDKRHPLIIDPTFKVLYSTYLGGVHDDQVGAMTLDSLGNAYVIGNSGSEDWPVSGNAYQTTRKALGRYVRNVVVTKFDASGTLIYSTFVGGTTNDYGSNIAVDAAGNAYLTGNTTSPDFPTTANAYQSTFKGTQNAYLAVLSPDGSSLNYSTLYGGSGGSNATGIALDPSGAVVIAGSAGPGLPTTAGSYKTTLAAGKAAFVAKFNLAASGNAQLQAASYYGVDNPQANSTFQGNDALSMTLDANGAPWLTGQAFTTNLPVTAGAIQAAPTAMSSSCAPGPGPLNGFTFVAKLSADLSSLPYASYLSGTTEPAGGTACSEFGRSIALDATGNVYITGGTGSANFPTTVAALQPTSPTGSGFASYSSFVTKLKPDGSAILWSTYFGGNVGSTFPGANIAFDGNANALWITTFTGGGNNYPITTDALQKVHGGGAGDAGIAQLDASSGALKYSTYLGGSADDAGLAIAIDSGGSVFLAGTTNSANFPTTANAFQPTLTENAFDGTDWFFSVLGSGTIGSVRPARGGNNGGATLTARGAGFQSDAVGSLLTTTGAVVASATAVNVAIDGTSADFVFTLDGVPPGSYDLRITNPDASVFTKSAAFVVEAGGTPALSVQVIGRPKIRTGVASTFQIVVSNTGSQDAYLVPLWVTVPNTISVSVDGLNVAAGSNWFADTGVNRFLTLIPFVKAGGSETLSMALTAPVDIANISINAALQAPWFRTAAEVSAFATSPTSDIGCIPNASNPYFINCAGLYFAYLSANKTPFTLSGASAPGSSGLIKTLNRRARPLGGTGCPTPPPPGNPGFGEGVIAGSNDRNSKPQGHTPNPWNGTGNNDAWNTWQAGYAAGWVVGGSAGGSGPTLAPLNVRALAACPPDPLPAPPPSLVPTGGSSSGSGGSTDPNDKVGHAGDGSTNHYIQAGIPMTYQVEFENQPTASLPAAEVVITDQLDPAKFELSTFTLGSISFGTQVVTVPAGLSSYATIVPINATLSVRIQGSLNTTTGIAKWTFTTLDSATGLPPSDPTVGFLPPDTDGIKGQGQVTFSIRQKTGLTDGAVIANQASIVFDANPAIATPIWTNVVDITPPAGRVQPIVQTAGATSFDVSWSTTGTGSIGRTYTVYVSDNGTAFTPWLTQVSSTSATYAGILGHTYGFYVIATDGAGNTDPPKTAAEASITVSAAGSGGGSSGGGGGCSMTANVSSLDAALLALLGFAVVMRRRSRR